MRQIGEIDGDGHTCPLHQLLDGSGNNLFVLVIPASYFMQSGAAPGAETGGAGAGTATASCSTVTTATEAPVASSADAPEAEPTGSEAATSAPASQPAEREHDSARRAR